LMSVPHRKTKLALLTNMIAPYRLPLYSVLADQFDLLVLHGGMEANRGFWGDAEELLSNAKVVRAWGCQIPLYKKVDGRVFDEQFIHITPGFIWHLLRFRPDAIISNELGFRSAVALAYGALFSKPVWIWWEGTLHSERNISLFRKVLRKILSISVDRWITCGQTSTEYVVSLGVARDRILELQNGVDEERFKADVAPAWMIRPRPVVLYVGRLVELKGVKSLLDAAAILQNQGHEFSLLLVGSGREKDALEARAKTLGLRNVHFEPAQPPEKMPSVYRSADVMVFPTLQDVWGFVANEAVLSGVPVLCSKYAGCAPDLFPSESIFSPDDLNEFCEKLAAAISGRLPKPDPDRLKTAKQLSSELVRELNRFLPGGLTNNATEPEPVIR
jgi:glycosyltransferase involved in cell wall biosynthesis